MQYCADIFVLILWILHITKSDGKENLQSIQSEPPKRVPTYLQMSLIMNISNAAKIKLPTKSKVEGQHLQPKIIDTKSMDLVPADSESQPSTPNSILQIEHNILASVRKTQQILQQKQQIYPIKERQKRRITHTIIMNQAGEQTNFQKGSNHKVHTKNWKRTRTRREISDLLEEPPTVSYTLKNASLNIYKGILLLIRLDNLLKNANLYLSEKEIPDSRNINYNITDSQNLVENLLDSSLNVTNVSNGTGIINFAYNITQSSPKSHLNLMDTRKNEYGVIYDDVMGNIRSMIKDKNIKFLDKEQDINIT